MKTTLKVLSLLGLLISLNAFAQEERTVANLDLVIQKEYVKVTPGEVESVTGIVPAGSEEIEIAGGVEETDAE